jgi:tRNA(Ile)-lysidine synthase
MRLVNVPEGKYIVAVSGGVDSMALLDMLRKRPRLQLVAVHVNHGMRPDAGKDEKTTRLFCMSHNITFRSKELHLSPNASEETARKARYEFLQHCRIEEEALAILTAHHQDDLIETAIINLLRGTGWRGLAPFWQSFVLRPLLNVTKKELVEYAKTHNVPWREDVTNRDQNYLRNYVRHTVVPKMNKKSKTWRQDFLRLLRNQHHLRRKIEEELHMLVHTAATTNNHTSVVQRYQLITLPHTVAYELLQGLMRQHIGNSLQREQAEAVMLFAKVARMGKRLPLNAAWQVRASAKELIVESRESVIS